MTGGGLGCVILASGQGTRFGSNKLLAGFGGKPLLAWVLEASEGVFRRRVAVTRHPGVEALCRQQGVPAVLHSLPLRSDTVRLGLEAVGEDLDGCLFCPGDQPLLSRESLQAMAECAAREPDRVWRLAYGGAAGAPVLFPRRLFPQLLALPPGSGGSVLLQKESGQVGLTPARSPWELRDVDSPQDLAVLLEHRAWPEGEA